MAARKVPLTAEIVKYSSEFHHRELITIPVVKRFAHSSLTQRCGLKAATLELDTAAHPNIEYVAGTRLSVYPPNNEFEVQFLIESMHDDLGTIFQPNDQIDPNYNSPFWVKFIQANRKSGDALRLALTYFLDISNFPSRELLRYIGSCCSQKAQRLKLESIVSNTDSWEHFLCHEQRTLRNVLEEFASARGRLSAKRLIIHELLSGQQPRQYSISSIKSSKRFRAEIIVFQHRFSARQIALNLKTLQEHERELAQQTGRQPRSPASPLAQTQAQAQLPPNRAKSRSPGRPRSPPRVSGMAQAAGRREHSVRSLRSVAVFSNSPISNQQVRHLPLYSGPLMSLYAASSTGGSVSQATTGAQQQQQNQHHKTTIDLASKSLKTVQTLNSMGSQSSGVQPRRSLLSLPDLVSGVQTDQNAQANAQTRDKSARFEGLCSNYLLNLQAGDQILCEFVENPRFTLKGNRERPIMMIAQDVGLVAFRPFWQQRHLEHDRAQIFYTLFKDLAPKSFGDMQLVCLTGNKSKVEDMFKREINEALTNKIFASVTYLHRQQLISLLDAAAKRSTVQSGISSARAPHLDIKSKELLDLGMKIYKLLVENNGCLYTCCDPYITQALEMLTVECILRNNKSNWTYEQIVASLPKWKGRKELSDDSGTFQLENIFERAQIVQEIYDTSI